MTECFLFFDLYARLRRSFLAIFCGLWVVHRHSAVLVHLQILFGREAWLLRTGPSHPNSDPTMAREGHVQGVPLPVRAGARDYVAIR